MMRAVFQNRLTIIHYNLRFVKRKFAVFLNLTIFIVFLPFYRRR